MDEVAREYLLIGLGVGRLEEGIVDAYYGPAELRTEAEEGGATAAQLAVQASGLRERLAGEVDDTQRAHWLDRQLIALETLARRLAGEQLDYLDEVERCFDARPEGTPADVYREVHATLDDLLPGADSLRERVDERNARLTVPADRLSAIVDWLVGEIRRDCLAVLPAPEGESLTVSMVTGQPWSAYNWYDGNLRSRIEINTDLPARAQELIALVTHEAFPGHHLEHSWKEARLAREQGRAEATIQLINTPEAYVSEGLAELGGRYVVARERWQELFAAICEQAGIPAGQAEPATEWQISNTLRRLRGVGADAALMLHAEGLPLEDVLAFLEQQGLRNRAQAEKNLEFIGHPLWRTYIFCYSGGERLLGRWCEAAGNLAAQRDRFFRLLTEQLTPSAIAHELG